jgi:hypothetical protein
MRDTLVVFGALIFAAHVRASTGPIPLNCDRACLEGVMNQYLSALAARDPKRLPLSADVRYTENDQPMDLGDGFWKTVESVGNYKHIFADPEAGQVVFMGTMHEAGKPLLMSVRLGIQLGRITEIEAIYFRQGGGGPANIAALDAPGYKPEDMWFKSIPPAINGFAMDCMSQFKLGYYFVVQAIHDRRYPLVDAERGVVWSHVVFDQGTVKSGVLSDGRPYTFGFFNSPSSILVNEAFLIENGKIRRVEMIGPSAFYHLRSPWGGISGH